MDDLTRWQLEEWGRRGREYREWLESSSVLEIALFLSQPTTTLGELVQMRAVADALLLNRIPPDALRDVLKVLIDIAIPENQLDYLFTEAARAAEIIRSFDTLAAGGALGIQASCAHMVAGLAGIHRAHAGLGATIEVTFEQDEVEPIECYEREFEAPAGEVDETAAFGLESDDEATAGRPVDDQLQPSGPDEASLPAASVPSLEAVNALEAWTIQRLDSSDGVHRFIFRGYGEAAQTVIDWLCAATQAFVNGDAPGQPSPLSAKKPDEPPAPSYWPDSFWPSDTPPTGHNTNRRKGGRPRLADDDWAYEQVRVNGRSLTDVYPEWLARIGSRAKALADPHNSFYKLMRYRDRDKMEKMD